jgi:threonine aldolase
MFFGCDNQSGASSQILEMLTTANNRDTHGYGDDKWTINIPLTPEYILCD